MITKLLRRKEIILCGVAVNKVADTIDIEKYKEARNMNIDSGWERVKSIFKTDDFGFLHPELVYAIQMTEEGFLAGSVIGGIIFCDTKSKEFMDNNDGSIFRNKREAFVKFHDYTVKGFVKGALKLGPKLAIFFGGFSLFTSCFEMYRNKTGIAEYVVGGTITGALLRFHFGLRGMLVGGIVGSALGTVAGVIIYSFLRLFKKDMLEYKYYLYSKSEYNRKTIDVVATPKEENVNIDSSSSNQHSKGSSLSTLESLIPVSKSDTSQSNINL